VVEVFSLLTALPAVMRYKIIQHRSVLSLALWGTCKGIPLHNLYLIAAGTLEVSEHQHRPILLIGGRAGKMAGSAGRRCCWLILSKKPPDRTDRTQ
jgi:hypothetical protein